MQRGICSLFLSGFPLSVKRVFENELCPTKINCVPAARLQIKEEYFYGSSYLNRPPEHGPMESSFVVKSDPRTVNQRYFLQGRLLLLPVRAGWLDQILFLPLVVLSPLFLYGFRYEHNVP